MLSDESGSDSDTGRFKGQPKDQDEQKNRNLSQRKEDVLRSSGRSARLSGNDRFRREFDRKRERYDRRSRERHRYRSPPRRSRHSRERSPARKSRDETRERSKPTDHRKESRSRTRRSPEPRKDNRPENKKDLREEIKESSKPRGRSKEIHRKSRDKSVSPEYKGKSSEVHKPVETTLEKKKSESPIVVEDHESDTSPKVQPASYYSMVPVVKEKPDSESSEIDSSDDEKLRAKLLNLEKELHKTRKKKHKRKHKKRKSSKSSKDRDISTVEVSSTTDIDRTDLPKVQTEEVTSTQKSNLKDSSEEGEISSGDDSQSSIKIDPTDLRHKLRRTKADSNAEPTPPKDTCGPALPPHLESKYKRKSSTEVEGPALPPHLKSKPRNIGPSIPEDMRKVLADKKHEANKESSEDDDGVGPLPAGTEEKWSEAHVRLEERALDMKIRNVEGHSLQKPDVKSREQWMLELPEAKAKIMGLEARSFRAKEGPDMSDRSSWTDTAEEKARKAAGIAKEEDVEASLKQDAKARLIANRDEEQEKAVKKHKKKHKREESLLEMHEKKLKKKKKKDEKDDKKERRPFSRDVDLQVNRFDEAQKKSIIKKAQALDTRFSSGEAKFL